MGQTYYFLNYSKNNKLVEKCPGRGCGEGFVPHKGGAQCQVSKCRYKQREEKHRLATPLMVNSCLKYKANVYTPNSGEDAEIKEGGFKDWGWSWDFSRSVYIPWYTLRSKKEFFDTVAHESGHILAYEEKFNNREKKAIKEYARLEKELESLSTKLYNQIGRDYETLLDNYYQKHKKTLNKYLDPWRPRGGEEARWAHSRQDFYPAYKKCFGSLLANYSTYNYKNSPFPQSFEEVRYYQPKKIKG